MYFTKNVIYYIFLYISYIYISHTLGGGGSPRGGRGGVGWGVKTFM
jgi:hypothetical protein